MVFIACYVVCCCLVVFIACFVACCWLFSGVHGLLCGVLQRPVRVRVLRNEQMLAVSLTPGPWSGRGNLGWVHHSQCWSPCRHCAAETEWRTQHSNRVTWGHWVNSGLVIHSLKVLFIFLNQFYAPAGGGGGGRRNTCFEGITYVAKLKMMMHHQSLSAMHKGCFAIFSVEATVRANMFKIWLFLLHQKNCWSFYNWT